MILIFYCSSLFISGEGGGEILNHDCQGFGIGKRPIRGWERCDGFYDASGGGWEFQAVPRNHLLCQCRCSPQVATLVLGTES